MTMMLEHSAALVAARMHACMHTCTLFFAPSHDPAPPPSCCPFTPLFQATALFCVVSTHVHMYTRTHVHTYTS
mgnify:CR=1 FL=1